MTNKKPNKNITLEHKTNVSGRFKIQILDGKTGVIESSGEWQNNLVLDCGIDLICGENTASFSRAIEKAHAGTGTAPSKVNLAGTFEQSGTSVTRATGSGVFAAGDVGKRIKFAAGSEQDKIVAFVSTTEITVEESRAIAATALDIYNTDRTSLDQYVATSDSLSAEPGAVVSIGDIATGDLTHQFTYLFSVETTAQNYTEIAVGNNTDGTPTNIGTDRIFARIVLDSAASVAVGKQLQVIYQILMKETGPITPTSSELEMTGWPYEYEITGIEANASNFTVTLNKDHHFVPFSTIKIENATPPTKPITSISSTSSEFTVNCVAHSFSSGNSIEIEGATVGAYNGTWVIDSITNSDNFVVTSAANPGASGAAGTVRKSVPVSWYNGEWAIAAVPAPNKIRITSNSYPPVAGAAGTVKNNLKVKIMYPNYAFRLIGQSGGSNTHAAARMDGSFMRIIGRRLVQATTPQVFPWDQAEGSGVLSTRSAGATVAYIDGTGVRTNTCVFESDTFNNVDIKEFGIRFSDTSHVYDKIDIYLSFDELQRKDTGYTLSFTVVRKLVQILA